MTTLWLNGLRITGQKNQFASIVMRAGGLVVFGATVVTASASLIVDICCARLLLALNGERVANIFVDFALVFEIHRWFLNSNSKVNYWKSQEFLRIYFINHGIQNYPEFKFQFLEFNYWKYQEFLGTKHNLAINLNNLACSLTRQSEATNITAFRLSNFARS
jgi:hypothetical protein